MLRYAIATGKTETDILAEYGVHVSGSTGLVGRPDFKKTSVFSWDYLNGESIDLARRRYDTRNIRLRCWLKASSKQAAVDNINTFLKAFDTHGLVRLHVDFVNSNNQIQTGTKGLFFLVYLADSDIKNVVWRSGSQTIIFDIILKEPSPVKRVLMMDATDVGRVTILFDSTSEFDIHWGDGSVTYDCLGDSSASHDYATTGKHYIIITGVIPDIASMSFLTSTPEITVTQIYDEI